MSIQLTESTFRILIIDDDESLAVLMKEQLELHYRADVEIVADAGTARSRLSESSYDIVLLDYQLPDANGLTLLSEITSERTHTSVIMVTGRGDESVAVKALNLGAAAYVVKDKSLKSMLLNALERETETIELKRARLEIERSKDRYLSFLDSTIEGIWAHDSCSNSSYANSSLAEMLGYSPDELQDRHPFEFLVEEHRDRAQALLEPEADRQQEIQELCFQRKDGSELTAIVLPSILRGRNGECLGTLIRMLNVSGLKRNVEVYAGRAHRFKAMFEALPFGVGLVNPNGRLVEANRFLLDDFGVRDQATLSRLAILDHLGVDTATYERLASGQPAMLETFIDFDAMKKALPETTRSSKVYMEVVLVPGTRSGVGRRHLMLTVRDITKRRRMENALINISRELRHYSLDVARNLEEPLSALKLGFETMLEMFEELRESRADTSGLEETVSALVGLTDRAYSLVEDSLWLARTGEMKEVQETTEVAEVVRRILDERGPEIKHWGIQLRVEEDLGSVLAFPGHVYRVFSELIDSAMSGEDKGHPFLEVKYLGIDRHGGCRYTIRSNREACAATPGNGDEAGLLPGVWESESGRQSIPEKLVRNYGGEFKADFTGGTAFDFSLSGARI